MCKIDQKIIITWKRNVLLLCIILSMFVLLTACGSSTGGNGQSTTPSGQGGGPGSSNSTGSQQRPDPCALITANQVQQIIPQSQFPAPTPGGNLNEGGIESSCDFTDVNGTWVTLSIDPAEPTWSGLKSSQANNPTAVPAVKGIGDDALFYAGEFFVLKGDYILHIQIMGNTKSDDITQRQEEQIAQEALKKW